jgi:transposase
VDQALSGQRFGASGFWWPTWHPHRSAALLALSEAPFQTEQAIGPRLGISGAEVAGWSFWATQLGGGGEFVEGRGRSVQCGGSAGLDWFGGGSFATAMLSLSPATRVLVALEPVDMRQSFNGLSARVQSVLGQEPTSGHYFLFTNKRRNRLKILFWDGSGLWVCAKRLEKGTFGWPSGEGPSRRLRPEELNLLLHGMEGEPRANWHRV